jgi:chloramphenicol-sensitive protein RarD
LNYLIALTAYILWGIFPLYWKLLPEVDSFEIICHRIVWSLLTLLLSISVLKQWTDIRSVLKDPQRLRLCVLAAVLISCNWFLFIWAVQHKYVVESSLGYFINPMMNVVLGVLLFRERLQPFQWFAVAIALLGVVVMASEKGGFPWLALSLAASFALYAAVKKKTTMPAIAGLGMETAILAPLSLLAIFFFPFPVSDLPRTSMTWTYLVLGGPITTIPLALFAAAAKHVPMFAMGMMQYIAPSMQFMFAVFAFHESVSQERMIGFAFIWLALLLFSGYAISQTLRAKQLGLS